MFFLDDYSELPGCAGLEAVHFDSHL